MKELVAGIILILVCAYLLLVPSFEDKTIQVCPNNIICYNQQIQVQIDNSFVIPEIIGLIFGFLLLIKEILIALLNAFKPEPSSRFE